MGRGGGGPSPRRNPGVPFWHRFAAGSSPCQAVAGKGKTQVGEEPPPSPNSRVAGVGPLPGGYEPLSAEREDRVPSATRSWNGRRTLDVVTRCLWPPREAFCARAPRLRDRRGSGRRVNGAGRSVLVGVDAIGRSRARDTSRRRSDVPAGESRRPGGNPSEVKHFPTQSAAIPDTRRRIRQAFPSGGAATEFLCWWHDVGRLAAPDRTSRVHGAAATPGRSVRRRPRRRRQESADHA